MRTPKEYTKNLENGIITEEMLSDALYSVNKRAKNWRDKKREYKDRIRYDRYYIDKYGNAEKAEASERQMYEKKELLLSSVKPSCIHREFAGFHKDRIYDTEKLFQQKYIEAAFAGRICWMNSFVRRDNRYDSYYGDEYEEFLPQQETWFFDRVDFDHPEYRYYLYYHVGAHTFHAPIAESDLDKYKDLQVYMISTLETYGHERSDLLSMQFVDKMISLIKTGKFELRFNEEDYNHDDDDSDSFDIDNIIIKKEEENRYDYLDGALDELWDIIINETESIPVPVLTELNPNDISDMEMRFKEKLLSMDIASRYSHIYEMNPNEKQEYKELSKLYNKIMDINPNIKNPIKPKHPDEDIIDAIFENDCHTFNEIKNCVANVMRNDIISYRAALVLKKEKTKYFQEHRREWACRYFPEFDVMLKRIKEIEVVRKQERLNKRLAKKNKKSSHEKVVM